jgi:endonuclease-8
MPEGPQMVFLKEQLDHFVDQVVLKAEGNANGIPFNLIKGKALIEIRTFGKELLLCFNGFTLRIHLMLFGKYAIDNSLNRELRLGLVFENGEINFYACECRFISEPLDKVYNWKSDVLHPAFNRAEAMQKLAAIPMQLICEALLIQDIFAGVGNKIKNEVLFRRRIHPESLVGKIPYEELEKLVDECVNLSREYLEWKREGVDDENWQVYKKKECLRDNIPLTKQKIGKSKRSCYFCDKCQHLYLSEEY